MEEKIGMQITPISQLTNRLIGVIFCSDISFQCFYAGGMAGEFILPRKFPISLFLWHYLLLRN